MSVFFVRVISVLVALFVIATMSLPFSTPSLGKSAKEKKMDQNRDKRDKFYDIIRSQKKDADAISGIIASLDENIETLEGEIQSIKDQFDQANIERDRLEQIRASLEEKLDKYNSNLVQRCRSIYMQGELTYLDMIFQATSFGDAIDRLYFVQTIVERDQGLVNNANDSQLELDEKLGQIDVQIVEIERIKQVLEVQQTELENARGDKQLLIEAINNDKALYEKQIQSLEKENKKFQQEIRDSANSAGKWDKKWTSDFAKPCSGTITSRYGMRKHPILGIRKKHTGVDISAPKGTRITVGGAGKVIFTGTKRGYGKTVIVDHGNNRTTLYAHMSKISCDAGKELSKGDKIGEVGSTGYSTGNHLHFEVRINGSTVDPLKHLN